MAPLLAHREDAASTSRCSRNVDSAAIKSRLKFLLNCVFTFAEIMALDALLWLWLFLRHFCSVVVAALKYCCSYCCTDLHVVAVFGLGLNYCGTIIAVVALVWH